MNWIDITRPPDTVRLETEEGVKTLSAAAHMTYGGVSIETDGAAVLLRARGQKPKTLTFIWRGTMPETARLNGDRWERGYGDFEWQGYRPDRVYPWYFFAVCGDETALYGVKTGPDALCSFTCTPHEVRLRMDLRSGGAPLIPTGETLRCAEIVWAVKKGASPFSAARELTRALCGNGVFPSEPVYGYNNWYYAYGKSSAEETLRSAEELSSLTKGLKHRPFLVIDDCWQFNRPTGYIGGEWRRSNVDFPDMAALAEQISAQDLKPGLWFRPLQNRDASVTPDMLLDPAEDILDPSHPDVLALIRGDVQTFVQWGYRLIKHDYTTFDLNGGRWGFSLGADLCADGVRYSDGTKTTAQIVKNLYRTIYEAAQGKALILGCNCIPHLGAGHMELNRTGDDTSGRDWERTRKMGINTLAFRMPQHGAFYAADADCVGITPAVPWEKNRQWLELLSLSGTPLFISVAPGTLRKEQYEDIRAAFTAASESRAAGEPLDWMNNACPERWRLDGKTVTFDW